MTRRTTRVAAIAAAAIMTASLAACSGGDDDAMTIWYRAGSLPTAAVEGVQDAFPDVKIELVQTPDVDTRIASALRSNSGLPDISIATLSGILNAGDKIVDVNEHGFAEAADQYLDWKVAAGQRADGAQIGIPVDIGPVGFFYRVDMLEAAGLPTEPAEVGALVATWDGYRDVAERVTETTGAYVCDQADSSVYATSLEAAGYYYYSDADTYDPDNEVNREAYLRAADFGQSDLCLNAGPYSQDWSAGVTQDQLVGWVGPAYQAGLLTSSGGAGEGQWRVTTAPGGAASAAGSNLSVYAASDDPDLATEIAIWLTNPENQAAGYAEDGLFPSTPASYDMAEMTQGDDYFGGQVTAQVLGQIAIDAPTFVSGASSPVALAVYNEALKATITNGSDPRADYEKAAEAAAQ